MTRFDADTANERRSLFADAIVAHRNRESPFLTAEVDPVHGTQEQPSPWIQFGDGTANLDCTEAELDRLTSLLEEFPSVTIEELNRPEEAEGVNVRLSAIADDERVAAVLDRTFLTVYELPEDYRVWVTEI